MSNRSGAYQKPDSDVICAVCQGDFKDPVIIGCHHSFCRLCIKAWIERDPLRSIVWGSGNFRCPSCRTINKIPSNGVSEFQTSFYIKQLKDASSQIEQLRMARSRSQSSYPLCPKHTQEDLRFYCMNCKSTVCRDCLLLKQRRHKAESVADVACDKRCALNASVEEAQKYRSKVYIARNKYKDEKEKLSNLRHNVIDMLTDQVHRLKNAIDNIAENAEEEINKLFNVHETNLGKGIMMSDKKLAELQKCCQLVAQEVEKGSDYSIVTKYKKYQREINSITDEHIGMPQNYESKLRNIYQIGTIDETEITNMLGTVFIEQNPNYYNDEPDEHAMSTKYARTKETLYRKPHSKNSQFSTKSRSRSHSFCNDLSASAPRVWSRPPLPF